MTAEAASPDVPPPRRSYRPGWVRLAWLAGGTVALVIVVILSNWVTRQKPPEEKLPLHSASNSGIPFRSTTVPTPPAPQPPPVPRETALPQLPPAGLPKPAAVKGSAGSQAASGGSSSLIAFVAPASQHEPAATGNGALPLGEAGRRDEAPDTALSASLRTASTGKTVKSHILKNARLTIPKGTKIPCTLNERIITQHPGFVTCDTFEEVRGWHGTVMLLPRWTRFFGQVNQGLSHGQDRVVIVWTSALTPDDVELDIQSPAVDGLGSAGFPVQTDNHVADKLAALALYTLIEAGPALAQTALQNDNRGGGTYNTTNLYAPSQNVIGGWLSQKLNQPPTGVGNQGELVQVMVAQNWDLSPNIGLEARQ